jgi:hypothetical protein
MKENEGMRVLGVQSGITRRYEPFVQITYGDKVIGQLNPEEAKGFAYGILEASEAAISDSILTKMLTHEVGLEMEAITAMLMKMRTMRQEAGKQSTPTEPGQIVGLAERVNRILGKDFQTSEEAFVYLRDEATLEEREKVAARQNLEEG